MSPVKRHRRIPTVVNRGLGLLEVIMPGGLADEGERALPPGQRDASGFWYPAGYERPSDLFTPAQRQMQVAQRRIQRQRFEGKQLKQSAPRVPVAGAREVARERRSRPPSRDLLLPPPLDDPPRAPRPKPRSGHPARVVDSRHASE